MIWVSGLRGYLLEEALAWLMRHSGYDLLVSEAQDKDELVAKNGALWVRGRGTNHQVDALGEFAFTPAFSLPVRLFLEAKFQSRRTDLKAVRNAYGTLADVNQNFVVALSPSSRPRRRFQYCYALFSAKGFTSEAEAFALAHQISLINLSIPAFSWLLDAVATCADQLHSVATRVGLGTFPVGSMRTYLRHRLGTASTEPSVPYSVAPPDFKVELERALEKFADTLSIHSSSELLVGFPPAPFVLALATDDRAKFIDYAIKNPSHGIAMRPVRGSGTKEWEISPSEDLEAYRLSFNLPTGIELWILDNEERRRSRVRSVKRTFLSTITIYFEVEEQLRVCHLRYQPEELRAR